MGHFYSTSICFLRPNQRNLLFPVSASFPWTTRAAVWSLGDFVGDFEGDFVGDFVGDFEGDFVGDCCALGEVSLVTVSLFCFGRRDPSLTGFLAPGGSFCIAAFTSYPSSWMSPAAGRKGPTNRKNVNSITDFL
jgi:hypothetical protein